MAPTTRNTRRVDQMMADSGRARSRLLSGLSMAGHAQQKLRGITYPGTYPSTRRGSASLPKSMSTARRR